MTIAETTIRTSTALIRAYQYIHAMAQYSIPFRQSNTVNCSQAAKQAGRQAGRQAGVMYVPSRLAPAQSLLST